MVQQIVHLELIYLVGVNFWQFELPPELMRKTLAGAIAAGVKNIILSGNVYSYGMAKTNPVREDYPREPHTFKGLMRKAQEDLLMQAHADGKINATVLRPPDFYGAGITSQRERVSEMERQTGNKLKLRVAGKTMLRLVGLFKPVVRELVEMNYLQTDPVIMDDSAL